MGVYWMSSMVLLSFLIYGYSYSVRHKCSDQAWLNSSPESFKSSLTNYFFTALKKPTIFQKSVLFIRIVFNLKMSFDVVLRIWK